MRIEGVKYDIRFHIEAL